MNTVAERVTSWDQELEALLHEQSVPLVTAVPETAGDLEVRARAARFIGACAAGRTAEVAYQTTEIQSLHEAIQLAAEGDQTARKLIETNVATDVAERTIKSGHVMVVELSIDAEGNVQQFGQSMEAVQANSLRLAANSWQMRERTEAEATNSFRINQYLRRGVLQEYSFVVLSRAADNMSLTELRAAGFFAETMSCAIQVTSSIGDVLTTESAFVAGVRRPGAHRHDADTISRLGERLGVDLAGKTAAETIDTPLLIHNSLLPNGVVDMVALYDACAGGTFFGEDRPAQDYLAYRQQCREREAMLRPKVGAITNELIAEAPTITTPVHATQRLHKISEKHMVQQAVFDASIDLRVFGGRAEQHILDARMYYELGKEAQAVRALNLAVNTAESSSCPGGFTAADLENRTDKKEELEDCEFVSKECPKCHAKNVKTVVRKGRYYGECGCHS